MDYLLVGEIWIVGNDSQYRSSVAALAHPCFDTSNVFVANLLAAERLQAGDFGERSPPGRGVWQAATGRW
jgi:hypothetical protein